MPPTPTVSLVSTSDFLEKGLIEHILLNTKFTTSGSVYIALFTTDPWESGSGTEVTGGDYTRIHPLVFYNPVNRYTYNGWEVTWPKATATWGNVSHVGIMNRETSGSLLFYGSLVSGSVAIESGDTFEIARGGLEISLGGAYSNTFANSILNTILNADATPVDLFETGSNIYLALYTTTPTFDTGGVEVSTTDYNRIQYYGSGSWSSPNLTGGSTSNLNDIIFTINALSDWGTITGLSIVTGSKPSLGTIILSANLTSNKTVSSGDGFIINANNLDVILT